MTELKNLEEWLRYEANKRFKVNPHDNTAHTMHEFANVIANGLRLSGYGVYVGDGQRVDETRRP